jgi:hypothetical protein
MKKTPEIARVGSTDCSACWWAVFPCGWKWEIGSMTRENESPIAIFRIKTHATDYKNVMWPNLGEVRPWPNAPDQPRGK